MKYSLTLILILFLVNANAQNSFSKEAIQEKYIHGIGIETDYSLFPINSIEVNQQQLYNQWESVAVNLSYFFRYNILELDTDQSISISAAPTLGLSFGMNRQINLNDFGYFRDVFGVGNLNLPITINYHLGKGATKNSTSRFGLNLSVGREFRLNPLISWAESPDYKLGLKTRYSGYTIKVGFLREKKRLHEIYFRTFITRDERINVNSTLPGFGSFTYSYSNHGNFALGMRFYRKNKS